MEGKREYGTIQALASLEASGETPESSLVKEETSASAEQREHEAIIAQMKTRLKTKIKTCTLLQEELRGIEAKITVLRTENMSEVQQMKQFSRDLTEEKTKISELRRQFTKKGKDHVHHLKKVHDLDTKSKALLFKEQTFDHSIRHSKEIASTVEEKTRELQRNLHGLKLGLDGAERELVTSKEITLELREKVQKKEFEIIRENYDSRVQIESLKRIIDERVEIIRNLESDRGIASDEIQRLSLMIERIREEAAIISARQHSQIKEETFRLEDAEAAFERCKSNIEEKEELLENSRESESLMRKEIATMKESNFALHSSVSESLANVKLLNSRVKDISRDNAALVQVLSDLDANEVLLQEKLKNMTHARDNSKTQLATAQAHVKALMEDLKEEVELDSAHGDAMRKAKIFARETEVKMGEMSAQETAAQARVVVLNTELALLEKDITAASGEVPKRKKIIEEKLIEGEQLTRSSQEKEQERAYKVERFEKQKAELERELNEKDATIDRLKRAITLTDAKNESIRSMMRQTDQMLREDREKLERRIVSAQSDDAILAGKLHDAEEKEYETELAMGSIEEKESILESRVVAARKELKPLVAAFDATAVNLNSKTKELERTAYDLEEKLKRSQERCVALVHKYDEEVAQEQKLITHLRTQQLRKANAKDKVEFRSSLESEYEGRIKAVERSLKVAEDELKSKTELCTRLLSEMKNADNISDFQEKQIRDEEASQAEMAVLLEKERSLVQEIDRIIKVKQGQFESDSNAVAERLMAYQNMLVERSETANRISGSIRGELETQKLTSAKIQEIKDAMELELVTYRSKIKSVVDEKDELKTSVADDEVNIMETKAEIQRATEAASDNRIKLDTKLNTLDVLKDEIDISRRESRQLRLQLETRGAYEKELFDSLKMKDETIKLLEAQVEDADGVDKSLRAQLRAMEHEKKVIMHEISSRKAAEDALVDELERTKMRFSGVAPIEDVNLQESMHRSDAHRAEYANALLKIIRPSKK